MSERAWTPQAVADHLRRAGDYRAQINVVPCPRDPREIDDPRLRYHVRRVNLTSEVALLEQWEAHLLADAIERDPSLVDSPCHVCHGPVQGGQLRREPRLAGRYLIIDGQPARVCVSADGGVESCRDQIIRLGDEVTYAAAIQPVGMVVKLFTVDGRDRALVKWDEAFIGGKVRERHDQNVDLDKLRQAHLTYEQRRKVIEANAFARQKADDGQLSLFG